MKNSGASPPSPKREQGIKDANWVHLEVSPKFSGGKSAATTTAISFVTGASGAAGKGVVYFLQGPTALDFQMAGNNL